MDIIRVYFEKDWSIGIELGATAVIGIVVLLAVALVVHCLRHRCFRSFEIDEAEIGIGTGKIKIRPNYADLQIAFQLWTELATRKIGIPFDEKHDVLSEVYDSWYKFFQIARELLKNVPVQKFRRDCSTREIVRVSMALLNDVLRPHLTRWAARYRRWWDAEMGSTANTPLAPQDIQSQFPQYAQLMSELADVSTKLVAYTHALHSLVSSD